MPAPTTYRLITAALLCVAGLLWWWQPAPLIWTQPDAQRLLGIGLLLAVYLLLCAWWLKPQQRAHAAAAADISVVYASQSGTAQNIARQTADALRSADCAVHTMALEHFKPELSHNCPHWLFVVSTTGEGDPPDHALAFARASLQSPTALAGLRYAVLALGDRSYPHFCAFGRKLDNWLRESQASPLFPRIEVDDANPTTLKHWQESLRVSFARRALSWQESDYADWMLSEREHLNPGSPGGAIFRLCLTPTDPTALSWQAGDIAEIQVPDGRSGQAHKREYSIASIAQDGRLELLVRRMFHPDGRPGLGSQHLTEQLEPGQPLRLRIRSNSNFHPPPDHAPLILIGNGTGLAGLRAHLHARQHKRLGRNWLLFGERSRQHDGLLGDELEQAQRNGALQRLDRTYSREGETLRYVQDAVLAAADSVRTWVAEGACIYICGSSHGMAPGVSAALVEILGQTAVDRLRSEGRYRSDVY